MTPGIPTKGKHLWKRLKIAVAKVKIEKPVQIPAETAKTPSEHHLSQVDHKLIIKQKRPVKKVSSQKLINLRDVELLNSDTGSSVEDKTSC